MVPKRLAPKFQTSPLQGKQPPRKIAENPGPMISFVLIHGIIGHLFASPTSKDDCHLSKAECYSAPGEVGHFGATRMALRSQT